MRKGLVQAAGTVLAFLVAVLLVKLSPQTMAAQAPAARAAVQVAKTPTVKTAWGEPDLQGLWDNDYAIPLQRAPKYADREFFTDAEIAEIDRVRKAAPTFSERVAARGTELDVAGAYGVGFQAEIKPTGRRTSLIVDPPSGQIPSVTPAVQKRRADLEAFRVALLQAVSACKDSTFRECARVKYTGVPSSRRDEVPPHYLSNPGFQSLNRVDNPEDFAHGERCLNGQLPNFGLRRIVQSPGSIAIMHEDMERVIPITTSPHVPSNIRLWRGDSRGHWEGNTLVVDVTNFTAKTDAFGSRENLHLIERYTRTNANTLEYSVTMDDSTTWSRPWTVKMELNRQDEQGTNQVYDGNRCHDTNYSMFTMLKGARELDKAFATGEGPDPATICHVRCGFGLDQDDGDPLNRIGR